MPQSKITTVSIKDLRAGKIVHVSDELAEKAIKLHEENMEKGGVEKDRLSSATVLMRHYATQNRLSPERIAELAKKPKASEDVRDLANLTTEELNALQAKML